MNDGLRVYTTWAVAETAPAGLSPPPPPRTLCIAAAERPQAQASVVGMATRPSEAQA